MEIRRDNPEFLKRTKLYIDKLYEQVGDLQVSKGGPIIMVQAENEFGSYVAQRKDIPLEEHRRDLSELKPSKRANHRRRYELMDQMAESIKAALAPWQAR